MFLNNSINRIAKMLLVAISVLTPVYTVNAGDNELCKSDIRSVIKAYEKALNENDVNKVIQNYALDGVFMPSGKPTSAGILNVKNAYQNVFKTLDLNVTFHFDEIVRRGDLAFVLTTSDGKIKLLEKNTTITNDSRELFVMKRINGDWKIYRYMFNETS